MKYILNIRLLEIVNYLTKLILILKIFKFSSFFYIKRVLKLEILNRNFYILETIIKLYQKF